MKSINLVFNLGRQVESGEACTMRPAKTRLAAPMFSATLLFSLLPLHAREFRGAITESITDAQGAVGPNVTVEIRNLDTNVAQTFRTNDSGVCVAPFLRFGAPNTGLTSPGFGELTPAQANDPRILQLAFRLRF